MGFSKRTWGKLASVDLDIPHDRRAAIRREARLASLSERRIARGKFHTPVSFAQGCNRSMVEERCGCGTFCLAPIACRISGVGVRTQGSLERIVFYFVAVVVHKVRKEISCCWY